MKSKFKEYIGYIIIIVVVILIRTFVVTPIKVNGSSMMETLKDGELMILKKYDKKIERYDIVVVNTGGEKIIKRVIGLPHEDIEYKENKLYINGEMIDTNFGYGYTNDFVDYCSDDEYFVMGDNREDSIDSRRIGCVNRSQISGKTNFVIFPFNKWGKVQ